jgi:Tat protein secretion system quality control protein TatD with DNase activity
VHTLRRLAELRGESAEELAAATTANFGRVFAWPE